MRHIKLFPSGKKIVISLLIVFTIGILLCCYFSDLKSTRYYVDSKIYNETVFYPEIISVGNANKSDFVKANRIIEDNLFGPYSFLSEEDVDVSMNYEVMYQDNEIISICFTGTYVVEKTRVNQFSFGLNINMKTQTLLTLKDVIGTEGIEAVRQKVLSKDFQTVYGMVSTEQEVFTINEMIDGQKAFEDNNLYYFCLPNKKIHIILTGYPSLAGNYSSLVVNFNW